MANTYHGADLSALKWLPILPHSPYIPGYGDHDVGVPIEKLQTFFETPEAARARAKAAFRAFILFPFHLILKPQQNVSASCYQVNKMTTVKSRSNGSALSIMNANS